VARTVAGLLDRAPAAWPSWAFENHDVARSVTRWGGGRPRTAWAKLLIALLTTLRGTAFLYQGQELGLPEAELPFAALRDPDGMAFWPDYKGRDGCRTPMPWTSQGPHAGFSDAAPWLPVPEAHLPFSVAAQEDDPASVLRFTRRFLAWRSRHEVLLDGAIGFLELQEPLLGFTRGAAQDGLTMVFNLGEADATLEWPEAPALFDLGARHDGSAWHVPVAAGLVVRTETGGEAVLF
jgi:alpha-glucosidase